MRKGVGWKKLQSDIETIKGCDFGDPPSKLLGRRKGGPQSMMSLWLGKHDRIHVTM